MSAIQHSRLGVVVSLSSLLLLPHVAAQTNNESLGTSAGSSITSGDNNVLIGDFAGSGVTTGSSNTMVGSAAGIVTNASDNTFVGHLSGAANQTGEENTFVGAKSGTNSSASGNTFVGFEAGRDNTSGSGNTFIGRVSGSRNTSGDNNTFAGSNAGGSNQLGFSNSFFGAAAGASNEGGVSNVAVGSFALSAGVNGRFNTAVGHDAGRTVSLSSAELENGIAARNSILGNNAGRSLTSGVANTLIGDNAGSRADLSHFNTYVGFEAGYAFGTQFFDDNQADRNTAVGAYAGLSNRAGNDNVWIGALANSGQIDLDQEGEVDYLRDPATKDERPSISRNTLTTIGTSNEAIFRSTVIGTNATVQEDDGTAIGYRTRTDGIGSIALGANAEALFERSVAIGPGATVKKANSVVIGGDTTTSWEPNLDGTTSLGNASYRFTNVLSGVLTSLADSGADATLQLQADGGTNDADRWQIIAANNGPLSIESEASGSPMAIMTVASSGNVTISGDLTLESDARRKTDIEPVSSALDLIEQVEGYRYRWQPELGRGDDLHLGFLAQEIQSVVPELVHARTDGSLAVNYQGFVPVLTSALKDLHARYVVTTEQQSEVLARQEKTMADLAELLEAQRQELKSLRAELAQHKRSLRLAHADLPADDGVLPTSPDFELAAR